MKVKCLIVDDEPLAIEVIKAHIEKIDSLEIVSTCQNAIEAFEVLKSKKIDLIFLDIQMPGMTGTELLRSLHNPPKVIMTTAYREYAIESYELDVVDYLLKPISFERFFKAINKYFQSVTDDVIIHSPSSVPCEEGFIYIRSNKKVFKILLRDILYVESLKDYLRIYTHNKPVVTKYTISAFEERLPANQFVRIHRSFIVSLDHISSFTANTIEVADKELPIGRSYKQQVFKTLNYTALDD